jgi:hypothetical protein
VINKDNLSEFYFDALGEKSKTVAGNDEFVTVTHLSVSNLRPQQSIVNMALNSAVSEISLLGVNPASGMERIPKRGLPSSTCSRIGQIFRRAFSSSSNSSATLTKVS